MTSTIRGVGEYVAAEAHTVAFGRLYKPDATRRPVVYFTGGPGDDRDFLTATASGSQITPGIVDGPVSFGVISAAFGGAEQWGNDTTQTRIGQAWTQVKSQLGTKTDKFVGIGISKGALALLNYARNNPSNVAAIVGIVPVVNLTNFYADNAASQTNIDAAYTDHAGYLAALATHDPNLNTATHLSQAIPMKLFYGTSDASIRSADVTSFASAVGATAQSMGATTHLTTAPAIVPTGDILSFIGPYL